MPAPLSGARAWVRPVGGWPIWALHSWLRAFVVAVIVAAAAAIIAGIALTPLSGHDVALFAVLLSCDLATVEFTRRSGEPSGHIRQAYAVWELPLALLLPPLYALLAPVARIAFTQWRVRKALAYRRIFTAAAMGLSYAVCSLAFHALVPALGALSRGLPLRGELWVLAVVASGVLRTAVNKLLVLTAINGADPAASLWNGLANREALFGDAAELSVGVLVAYVIPSGLFMVLFFLPFVTLLQRSQRHTQLVSDARIDGKTGLLNATTWQAEAAVQVTRGTRNRDGAPVAVLMIDIDHFKLYNDTYGHPAGDIVLAEVAATFTRLLREYDLCGRWGGEEFAVLLVDADAAVAADIARRLCSAVSELSFPATTAMAATGGGGERVTVSIGVANLGDGPFRGLDEMVAAADYALYQAKDAGRNTVRLASELPRRG